MQHLNSIEEFHEKSNGKNTVFMFTADWCPDCRVIDPIMPEIEAKFNEFTFISVDRDRFIDLCIDLNIFGIPSFLGFVNGKEAGRFVSKDRKTKQEIESFIESLKI
ncbi:MAG TPA: thioredoxin family protein [Planococcus sp. (in: firmicutes)]|nr:thioredoxin family protein [Planococcus sp. (in: firmicutes)]